jgi:hypothetical protein
MPVGIRSQGRPTRITITVPNRRYCFDQVTCTDLSSFCVLVFYVSLTFGSTYFAPYYEILLLLVKSWPSCFVYRRPNTRFRCPPPVSVEFRPPLELK